jgi:hypothetical protein
MKIPLIIFIGVLSIPMNAQFIYFNEWWDEVPEFSASVGMNIFIQDSGYVTIGSKTGSLIQVRKLTSNGVLGQESAFEFDHSMFIYSADQYLYDSVGNLVVLTQINAGDNAMSFLSGWNQDFELISTEITGLTSLDTAVIMYSGMRPLSNDTIALAGVQGYNTDSDGYPEEYEVILWKRGLSGVTIWKKTMFYQQEKSMFVCDFHITPQGEYLIVLVSGTGINKNHVIIKADSEGNYIDHYEWGGEYNEYKCRMLPLDNGNYLVFYEDVTWMDIYPMLLDLHVMEFNPATVLPVDGTDQIINTPYTNDIVNTFQIDDFLKTPDGGYAVMMNFRENDPIQYQPFILKLDSAYQYEWMKTYAPDSPWIQGALFDFEVTHDGGFIATGDFVYPPEPQSYFRHWVIKLDACGDVEYMDCPFVDVVEHSLDPGQGLFSVFPNPASGSVSISSAQEFESITIRDVTGKVVLASELSNHVLQTQVDVSMLAKGIYLLEVDFGNGHIQTQRLAVE